MAESGPQLVKQRSLEHLDRNPRFAVGRMEYTGHQQRFQQLTPQPIEFAPLP